MQVNTELINKIRESFVQEEVKQLLVNDFLGTYWYDINKVSNIQSTGFCYLASEIYYQLNGKSKVWWFCKIDAPHILPYNGIHYFLKNKETGEILDITEDQFENIEIPYHLAKNIGVRYSSKQCNKFKKILGL